MDSISKQHTIWTFVMSSIIVSLILAISHPTFPFVHGQADFILTDTPNSKNISNDFSDGLGSAFYTESTKSTNIRVTNIDPILTVEVTYTGNNTIGGAPTQTIGTIVDKCFVA